MKKINLKDPKLKWPVLISVIGLGIIALWYYYAYTPTMIKITELQKKTTMKQDTLRTIQALKPQLNKLREELHVAELRLDSLKSIFPDQK